MVEKETQEKHIVRIIGSGRITGERSTTQVIKAESDSAISSVHQIGPGNIRRARLTERQRRILAFLQQYVSTYGYPPSLGGIGKAVGIQSVSVVNYNLNRLKSQGYITRDRTVSRGVRLVPRAEYETRDVTETLDSHDSIRIPILGFITANASLPAESLSGIETVEISRALIGRDASDLFALQVKGNSMIDAMIADGDLVILCRQASVENGEMAAVWLEDQSEITLKKVYYEGNQVRLQPANPTMASIYFLADKVRIQGKVVMVIRRLMQEMRGELDELKEAQRQQVEELLRKAVALRRPRSIYSSPDPDLHRQMVEFRTQMDLMQWVILDRYTGAESPKAENRRYGEIYLQRGVIAYYDNDVLKSREMLRIAERFFPFSEQETESMSREQRLQTAFTQFYLALIEKNYGEMTAAREHIERSYAVYGRNEPEELMTPATRAEILSYLGDMDNARTAIQEVLGRADNLRQRGLFRPHHAIYALRARLLLGNTYYVSHEWQQAFQHYQDTLKADVDRYYSYYVYHSVAQVHHKLGNEEKVKENKRRAYEELVNTGHLRTKVALDTRILLNALAYLCTREDKPQKAQEYRETIQELWLRIREVNGLQLRLFSFEKKRPISKEEFWAEVFSE